MEESAEHDEKLLLKDMVINPGWKKILIASNSITSLSYLLNVSHPADCSEEQCTKKMASSAMFFISKKIFEYL